MNKAASALVLASFVALSAIGSAPAASAAPSHRIQIDVPLYSDPASAWSTVTKAGPAIDMIVFNPSSGPGDSPLPIYQSLLTLAQAEGISVIGYVPTAWAGGAVSIAQAEAWITEYYSWYGVDGILLDETNDTCASAPLNYYTTLYNFVKQQAGADLVVLNPGTVTGDCYAKISDILVTFEDTYANYLQYQPPGWMASYPGSHFLNIILDTPAADVENAIDLAVSRGAYRVYVTDMGANGTDPYSSLPSYFGFEVSYVSAPIVGTNTLSLVGGPTVNGLASTVTVTYRNSVLANLTGSVYLVVHNPTGQTIYFSTASLTLTPGAEVAAILPTGGVPRGVYNASVFAVDASGIAISRPVSFSLGR